MATTKNKSTAGKGGSKAPDHELISERAYQIYLDRIQKGLPGNTAEDWIKAQKELRKK